MKQMRRNQARRAAWLTAMAALVMIGRMEMPVRASADERLEGGVWIAEDISGGGVIDDAQPTVAFAGGGKVTGSGGCNRLFGTVTIAGDALTFGGIGTTRMACAPALMGQEQTFLAALSATRSYRLEGPYLRFYDAGGAEVIRFTRNT